MIEALDSFRQLTLLSVLLRLFIAALVGGLLGLERARKGRAAGFRTYMLVSLGAALTFLIAQYNVEYVNSVWSKLFNDIGVKADISRFSAQVINGIGFLGAGTIIVTGRQQVKGLTTAAGLWASGCMGIAVGAGFYECVLIGFALVAVCMRSFNALESRLVEKSRFLNIYVEFTSMDDVSRIISRVRSRNAQILDIDLNKGSDKKAIRPSMVLAIKLAEKQRHSDVVADISELVRVHTIEEI
ncbi:MAG: MgtC/SapB family protein [Lachnospiraceae bacterium]|nr:MgtC/SapB family protein [Lachnospiraceae bacterium]